MPAQQDVFLPITAWPPQAQFDLSEPSLARRPTLIKESCTPIQLQGEEPIAFCN